ncbi:hypothetical protein FRC12_012059 [Ceratobasidium sp. 428]|nr:hypothetical protein FRC12_012059 [Ceratobasidium sp. 428]
MTEAASTPELGSLSNLGDNREESAQRALQVLKQIEQSGGSAAFENWLKETNNGADAHILPDFAAGLQSNAQVGFLPSSVGAWSNDRHIPVHAKIFSVGLYTILELRASVDGSDYFGSGGAFGLGVGYLNFDADMVIHDGRSFESFKANVSRFWFFAGTLMNGQPTATIRFYDQAGNDIATAFAVIGFGIAAAFGFKGDFEIQKLVTRSLPRMPAEILNN